MDLHVISVIQLIGVWKRLPLTSAHVRRLRDCLATPLASPKLVGIWASIGERERWRMRRPSA